MRLAGGLAVAFVSTALGCSSTRLTGPDRSDGSGVISIQQTIPLLANDFHVATYSLDAYWQRNANTEALETCKTVSLSSACSLTTCEFHAGVVSNGGAGLDAGILHFSDNGEEVTAISYGTSISPPGYLSADEPGLFFKDGDTVAVRGDGGADLPAFPEISLPAPSTITLTEPVCPMKNCPSLDSSHDLSLAWSGGGVGTTLVSLEEYTDTGAVALGCAFASSAGQGTVPTAMLDSFPDTLVSLNVYSVNEQIFSLAGAETTFEVAQANLSATVQISR